MKKLLIFLMVLASVGAVQALSNGSFENGFTEWETWLWSGGTVATSTDAFRGLASADFGGIADPRGGAGAFHGALIGAGVPVSISAYIKGTGPLNRSGIDLCFFAAAPTPGQMDPPTIGRVDLFLTGTVTESAGYTGDSSGSLGSADEQGWRYGHLEAVTPTGTAYMKYEINNNGDAGHILFDSVAITPTDDKTLPHDPAPAENQIGVLINSSLSWTLPKDPNGLIDPNLVSMKLYFGTDPNILTLPFVADITSWNSGTLRASYTPSSPMSRDAIYYWRVNTILDTTATLEGAIWTFDTEKSIPVITTQPVSVRVSTPAAASFTTVFTCASAPTVTWYKNGVLMPGAGTRTGTNPYTATLAFATTSDGDQADYYCRLVVSGQDPVQSNTVNLVTKKLLAHYEFEDNLLDSSTFDPHNGTGKTVADPNITTGMTYDTGMVGSKAVVLDGTAIVDLGTGAYPRGSGPGTIGTGVGLGIGMDEATVSCWIKTTYEFTGNCGLLTNYNTNILANPSAIPPQPAADTTGFGMELTAPSLARVHLRGENPGPPISGALVGAAQGAPIKTPAFNMQDGLWHHVAVSWKQGGQMIVYVDGSQVAAAAAAAGTREIFAAPQRGVVIGGIRTIANRAMIGELYQGLMDSLRVYNYALSSVEVAYLYYDESGRSACGDPQNTILQTYDFNDDCKVDLGDLAMMASNWLYTQNVPGMPR